jgi:hypothetical protein
MLGCSPISNECVSEGEGLRKEILSKTHHSLYAIHSRSSKMYIDVKGSYWWNNMKKNIARFVE